MGGGRWGAMGGGALWAVGCYGRGRYGRGEGCLNPPALLGNLAVMAPLHWVSPGGSQSKKGWQFLRVLLRTLHPLGGAFPEAVCKVEHLLEPSGLGLNYVLFA